MPLIRGLAVIPADADGFLRRLPARIEGSRLAAGLTAAGACAFFEPERGRRCRIHRMAGERLLPSACRNFPRVALRDARGLSITLSHYCPTAARLLLGAAELSIVEAPPSLSLDGEVEGLDATAVMPPLLGPGMLTDPAGYDVWEREAVAVLNDAQYSAPAALMVIRTATTLASGWRPGTEPLATCMHAAYVRARRRMCAAMPRRNPLEHPAKAFLAAHLFGSWAAYQHRGLPAVCDEAERALTLLGSPADENTFVDAVRRTDFEMRHRASSR